ncbi:hypothetical protein B7R22_15620 [Subtercola boreus]|uniref:HTH merR-type domain-containing protein n=1 Tax=Subtercola boreus TaxID=120213 RepID=A0A3E0VRD7_9MICO|nr:hypothetical protein B7R22_15620 [Subtercola boreus]
MAEEWPIQKIAALGGTTSRTLRHYGDLGLLAPSRIGANGYRYYDQAALVRLQRILLLRRLGLGLNAIAEVLAEQTDPVSALGAHLDGLRLEQQRIARQIGAVELTLDGIQEGTPLMAETMFDGFDHTVHEGEVAESWGMPAYAASDAWWRGLTDAQRHDFTAEGRTTAAAFGALNGAGSDPAGPEAQALVERHVAWLARALGGPPPTAPGPGRHLSEVRGRAVAGVVSAEYLAGLGDLYVADDRFGRTYDRHGAGTAAFVRDALRTFAILPACPATTGRFRSLRNAPSESGGEYGEVWPRAFHGAALPARRVRRRAAAGAASRR